MRVRVLLFGNEARAVGQGQVDIALDGEPTCASLRRAMLSQFPALGPSLGAARFAVNHEFADDSRPLREGEEVALIGMVSGG